MTTLIRDAEARRSVTPNATMTTFASPTQGSGGQALWRVAMEPGASGPEHAMAGEQIWTVLRGGVRVVVGEDEHELGPGDTVVLPADRVRQLHADAERGVVAIVTGPGGDTASGPGREPVVPPWIA